MVAPFGVEGPAGVGGARDALREGGGAARGGGLCRRAGLRRMRGGGVSCPRLPVWSRSRGAGATIERGRKDAAGATSPSWRTRAGRTADAGTASGGVGSGGVGGGVARPPRVRGTAAAGRPRGRRGGTKSGPFVASAVVRRLRGRGCADEARGGGQSPADEAAVGTAAADVAADKAAGARGGRRDRAPRWTYVREERRLRGQGRGTAVQGVPAHEAAAAGEERGEGGGRAPPHASPRDSRGRDIALRGRMPRGRSWGMSPRRRERGAGSRGGSGGPPAAARGRGRGRSPTDEAAGGVRRRRRNGWRGGARPRTAD